MKKKQFFCTKKLQKIISKNTLKNNDDHDHRNNDSNDNVGEKNDLSWSTFLMNELTIEEKITIII